MGATLILMERRAGYKPRGSELGFSLQMFVAGRRSWSGVDTVTRPISMMPSGGAMLVGAAVVVAAAGSAIFVAPAAAASAVSAVYAERASAGAAMAKRLGPRSVAIRAGAAAVLLSVVAVGEVTGEWRSAGALFEAVNFASGIVLVH